MVSQRLSNMQHATILKFIQLIASYLFAQEENYPPPPPTPPHINNQDSTSVNILHKSKLHFNYVLHLHVFKNN